VAGNSITNSGGRYNPSTDTWQPVATSPLNARRYHCAVWTGSELVVWGGYNSFTNSYLGDGARYNPVTDSWVNLPTGPAARINFSAVWTGSKMIVWGGFNGDEFNNTGSAYDPILDSWTVLPTMNAPSKRQNHSALWTGTEMFIWGGDGFNDGGFFQLTTNEWQPLKTERLFFIYQKP
jgi:N-acetylneuraminic acid mutarotase